MHTLVINGNPRPTSFDTWIEAFCKHIGASEFRIRNKNVRPCTGCWSCWYRTPGLCMHADDASSLYPELFNADLVVWASPLILGCVSALTKTMQDRFIPQVHPYIELVNGESHHQRRYAHNPRYGIVLQRGAGDTDEDVALARTLLQRHALNARTDGRCFFCETTTPPTEAAHALLSA